VEETIDLLDYWRVIRKRWLIIMVLPIIAVITAGLLSFFVMKPVYQASALVIVGKRTDAPSDKTVEYNSIMANQQLAKTYQTIAKSRTVLERVAEQIGGGLTPEQLDKQLTVEAVKSTEVIAIKVEDNDPQRAALIANKVTSEFSNRVIEVKKVDSVGLVDAAIVPTVPVKPNKTMNMALALVLGLFTAIGLVFFLEFIDNTIKAPGEVEELTGLTVLGTIPEFTALGN
jgi:capsular polysaccharide biosynthesis protein